MEFKTNLFLKLSKLNKKDLINLAKKHNLTVDLNGKKDDLVNQLFYIANKTNTGTYRTPKINIKKQPFDGQVYAVQGQRPSMEDTHLIAKLDDCQLYAVFDGHGGNDTSNLLPDLISKYLLEPLKDVNLRYNQKKIITHIRNNFITIDNLLQQSIKDDSGSTATMSLVIGNTIYIINLGDSRTVVFKYPKNKNTPQFVFSSNDHKPDNPEETSRIYQAGGFVEQEEGDDSRLDGYLAISRSFGDFDLKYSQNTNEFKGPLSIEPDIKIITKKPEFSYYGIIACDGLWDVMDNKTAIKYINSYGINNGAKNLTEIALHKDSSDNVSVISTKL